MTLSEVRKWAKEKGYTILKDKGDPDSGEPTQYYWSKVDDITATGVSPSLSKVAKAIFNHMTNNKWEDYQKEYQELKNNDNFNTSSYPS